MALKLMAVLAHPDDESLGFGGTLATYAAAGVETSLVMATRGEAGRYGEHRRGSPEHPGPDALARIREGELRAAAAILGIRDIAFLDYRDQELDRADPREAVARIVHQLRRTRPDVVLTFGQDGAYGHPDHIAICQFATAAVAVVRGSVVRVRRRRRAASGRQAVLHRLAGVDVGRLRERVEAPDLGRRRRRAAGRAVAGLVDHDGDRHARVVGDRVARRVVSRVADGHLRAAEGSRSPSCTRRCGARSPSTAS